MKRWTGSWTMGTFEIVDDGDGTYSMKIVNYATTSGNDHVWFHTLRQAKMYLKRNYGDITEIIEEEIE